jgi:soluble epoxide hydrolase/lipid-phosphate phosphatase
MSVPYTPPSRQYVPVEEVARRAPNLGYQVYLANQRSSMEVLAHVRPISFLLRNLAHWIYHLQLKKFLPLIFSPPESKVDFTMLDSLENILIKQPARGDSCILNEKVHFCCLSFPRVDSQRL